MGSEDDALKTAQIVDARARNISHNVRCTECGNQSIEDSQADIAILRRKEPRWAIIVKDWFWGRNHAVRGVPLTRREKETMLELLTPPPSAAPTPWWSRLRGR